MARLKRPDVEEFEDRGHPKIFDDLDGMSPYFQRKYGDRKAALARGESVFVYPDDVGVAGSGPLRLDADGTLSRSSYREMCSSPAGTTP